MIVFFWVEAEDKKKKTKKKTKKSPCAKRRVKRAAMIDIYGPFFCAKERNPDTDQKKKRVEMTLDGGESFSSFT